MKTKNTVMKTTYYVLELKKKTKQINYLTPGGQCNCLITRKSHRG